MNKMNFQNLIKKIIFLWMLIFLLGVALFSTPVRHGDGHEYSLISKAFINHLSPEIRTQDVVDRMHDLKNNRSEGYSSELFDKVRYCIDTKSCNEHGIFISKSGLYYGYHFWFYPLFSALAEYVTMPLGVNPLAGFQIANALILLVVAYYFIFLMDESFLKRITILFSFVFGGSLFYLKWTHPELFVHSMIFLSFILLFRKNYISSMLFLALAAMQVVTLWIVFLCFPIYFIINNKSLCVREVFDAFKLKISWIILIIPSFSLIFYYVNFNTISLIGDGYVDLDFVSVSHLISTYFDMDQGVFVGVPWLIIPILIFIYRFKEMKPNVKVGLLIASLGSLLIIFPLLAHANVNSGQSVFQRYGFYAVAPLVAWAGYYFIDVSKGVIIFLIIALLAFVHTIFFSGPMAREDYLHHKPWVNYLLQTYPDYYNPEPGIFFGRSKGVEWQKSMVDVAVYKDSVGVIRKILYPIASVEDAIKNICDGKIVNLDGAFVDWTNPTSQAYGWGYKNGYFKCDGIDLLQTIKLENRYETTYVDGINFQENKFPTFVVYISGLSGHEPWGRWSDGSEVLIKLNTNLPKNFSIKLTVGSFANNLGKPVSVDINGVVKSFVVQSNSPKEYSLDYNFDRESTDYLIRIKPPEPVSPLQLGISQDSRLLGISFVDIKFQ